MSQFGYGNSSVRGYSNKAHRAVYQLLIGPIPLNLHLHHTCENRACVNPEHLELIDPRAHNVLHNNFSIINEAKTCCPKGHEFTPENTRYTKKGWRHCIICNREYDKQRWLTGTKWRDGKQVGKPSVK